ncbi:hypothetical protein ACIMOF_04190 [Escherichia coli]
MSFSLTGKLFEKDAYIVGFVTMMVYIIAFAREYSFAVYYEFPYTLIEITTGSLIVNGLASFLAIYIISIIISSVFEFLGAMGKPGQVLTVFIMPAIPVLFIAFFNWADGNEASESLPGFYVLILAFYIAGLYRGQRGVNSPRVSETQSPPFLSHAHSFLAYLFFATLFLMAVFRWDIRNQDSFNVFHVDNREYALIRLYGDTVIAGLVENHKLKKGSVYFKREVLEGQMLISEKFPRMSEAEKLKMTD